ncbi:molybdopterin-binding protein [Mucilaginibacter psychrotolerans]|uniref:Molybdopterin-binding protein n=1 Tax=Mucilaginibacter psychrotolerans TaxID=1524096 RepID=A0A4Y8SD50_9SPHI|nr:molybdopterin-binding protein [Mucilaginibacter psychrotolerans]TFF36530.1 molybdopterin-binding protein [Mucilaginibacter psychrotolerans]
MKKLLTILLFIYANHALAQDKTRQTLQFSITGEVEKTSVITLDSLKQYKVSEIGDINVTDHTGAFKHKDDQLKGVLLKDVLSHTKFKTTSPKLLSRFYLVCTGIDGYKVVYSWNELYNTSVGDHVYIIMEKNGMAIDKMPESIQMTAAADFKTGRRYLHNLDKIVVGQVQ